MKQTTSVLGSRQMGGWVARSNLDSRNSFSSWERERGRRREKRGREGGREGGREILITTRLNSNNLSIYKKNLQRSSHFHKPSPPLWRESSARMEKNTLNTEL